jgi:23S rRNA pseudouridine1911/1915/1917 synthase
MLVSKTMKAHAGVIRAMGGRAVGGVKKEYLAVVHGAPDPPSGEIACRLRRDPADTRRVAVSETEGKECVTRYRVAAVSHRDARDSCDTAERRMPGADGRSLVLCEPLTGRMHQLRVHLAARGWPIVGDPVYGPGGDGEACPTIGRQALHAWRVSLTHPISGAPLVVTAPVPPDFATLLEHLGLSWVQA